MDWMIEHWPRLAVGAALLVLLAIVVRRARERDPKRTMEARLEADASIPLRRWVQAASMLVTRNCDYGYLDEGEARRMLHRWWHVHGRRDLHDTLDELAHSPHEDNAWELLRFLLVVRLGVAAGMIPEDDGWDAAAPIARRLQRAYDDWPQMGQAYVQARRQWRSLPLDGSDDDDAMRWVVDNLHTLRADLWVKIPFALDLESDT